MISENLKSYLQPDLGPAPDVILGKAVGTNEWMGFINNEGKIENVKELKRLIHSGVSQRLNVFLLPFLTALCWITKDKYEYTTLYF